ncbi:uncharacterized protein LOC130665606 [Microplitis mediator]|uniref:uncharacterized protein LOC130665606 n=1 Tax=Microplitis mediator TaxID=375433 RepID=UPI0025566C6E|nr:uncharacterized protein LOC130665606 [Microplitis mediator]
MEDTRDHRFSASERSRQDHSGSNERVPRGSDESDQRLMGPCAPDLPSNSTGLPEESGEIEEEIRPSSPPLEQPVVVEIVNPRCGFRGRRNRRRRRNMFAGQIDFAEAEIVNGGSASSDESGIDEVPVFDDRFINDPIDSDDEYVMHDEGVGFDDADL